MEKYISAKEIMESTGLSRNVVYAMILIVVVVFGNAPALKGFRERYSLGALFAKISSKKKHDPSKQKDNEAKWARIPTKIKMDEVLSVDIQPTSPYTPDKTEKEDK
jgi:hypothetical protein